MKHIINKTDYTKEVDSLTNFAQKRMGFSNVPKILFDDDIPNSQKTLGKTGYYDPNTSEIHIYASGRHIKDILRSLAHEFVHHMQNEKGDLTHDGYMGQGYAQKNPKMREMERQAYEMGNLCFRDWEDSLKEKHPTIYNERRNRKMSLKDWKNKELNENLNKKWGFKMDLSKLNEGYGAGPMDPMGGQSSMEMAPPMSNQEVAIEDCIQQKVAQGMSACDARPQCEQEMGMAPAQSQPPMQMDPEMPFQENKKMVKGPDGEMVPDYAADGKGENDLEKGKGDKKEKPDDDKRRDRFDKKKDDEEDKEKKKFKPKKGEIPPQFKKNMKESLNRRIRVKVKR